MKKVILSLAVAAISLASYKKADAQVSVQINIGGLFSATVNSAPMMSAPMVANAGDYYYYNDINCYYDVANCQYIYPYDGGWYYSSAVPVMYRNYDFRNARRTAMDRRAFLGRGINPVAYNRPAMVDNRGYNNPMGNGRMEQQDRFAQQNFNRQPQMQQERQMQVQRAITMNNNGREMREARRR